jgi:hypothetical protein
MLEVPEGQRQGKAGVVDVLFLLDQSGSMHNSIQHIVDLLSNFDSAIKTANTAGNVEDIRYRVAAFCDLDEDGDEAFSLDFSRNWTVSLDDVKVQLSEILQNVAKGKGGDEPESLFDALYHIVSQNIFDKEWGERTRVVIVFTDATSKVEDARFAKELGITEKSDIINQLAVELAGKHIKVFLVGPNWDGYSELSNGLAGKQSTRMEYLAKGDPFNSGEKDDINNMELTEFKTLIEQLGKEVSEASL